MSPRNPEEIVSHLLSTLRRSALTAGESAEQLANLLYLKWLDEDDQQRAASGQTRLFEGAAERYRWCAWSKISPSEMKQTLSDGVFPYLASMVRTNAEVGDFFRSAKMTLEPHTLVEVVHCLGGLHLLAMTDRDRGALFVQLLAAASSSMDRGQFNSPTPLRRLMVALAQPAIDDSILDPCCGVGGLITEAYSQAQGNRSVVCEAATHSFAGQRVRGVEHSWSVARLARLNLLFHGLSGNEVTCGNALTNTGAISDDELKRGFSLVLAVPPFGGRESGDTIRPELAIKTRQSELLFLSLAMRALAPSGRAVMVVPDGVLFGSSDAHMEVRRQLVEEHQLLAVISLGTGAFAPYTAIKSNILVFRKPEHAPVKQPNRVWFYELPLIGLSKTKSAGTYPGSDLLVRLWNTFAKSDFSHPPGIPANTILRADAPEPEGYWADQRAIEAKGYVLTANAYKPQRKDVAIAPATIRARLTEELAKLQNLSAQFRSAEATPQISEVDWSPALLSEVTINLPSFDASAEPDARFNYVDLSSLDRERNVIANPKRVLANEMAPRARRRLQEGDVLISSVRPAATGIAIVTSEWDGAIASGDLCVLRANPSILNSKFLLHLCLDSSFIQQLNAAAGGTTIPRVSESQIKGLKVKLPPLLAQKQLVESLANIELLGQAAANVAGATQTLLQGIRRTVFQSKDQPDS
jgi:type I restriction enzyme M protein